MGGVWCNIPRRMEYEELIREVREMRADAVGVSRGDEHGTQSTF